MIYLAAFQDPFKYSYPPLPDDDFQTPISDNGPIVSEDETESKDGETEGKDTLESSFNSEVAVKPKKVHFLSGFYLSSPSQLDFEQQWSSELDSERREGVALAWTKQ